MDINEQEGQRKELSKGVEMSVANAKTRLEATAGVWVVTLPLPHPRTRGAHLTYFLQSRSSEIRSGGDTSLFLRLILVRFVRLIWFTWSGLGHKVWLRTVLCRSCVRRPGRLGLLRSVILASFERFVSFPNVYKNSPGSAQTFLLCFFSEQLSRDVTWRHVTSPPCSHLKGSP